MSNETKGEFVRPIAVLAVVAAQGGLQWWCSAAGTRPWSWTWRPYPGVWLFVLLAGLFWLGLARRHGGWRGRGRWFAAGLVLLWATLDWPVGALSGYLASAHMVQYLSLSLLVPPALLLGVPRGTWRALAASRILPAVRLLTHPLVALGVFQVVLIWTHLPAVVDGWMATQFGSLGLDMLWLAAGLVFWWPVLAPVPERSGFSEPLKMGYLFVATILNTLPYAFLTFGELPFYGIYELAPPVGWLGPRGDQQVAGLLMKVGGGLILWTAITILWFRWYGREQRSAPVPPPPGAST